MSEEVSPFALTGKGIIDIQDEDVRDNINALLNGVTMKNSATPYTALEHVKKVLANFHIFLPRTKFLEGDSGYDVWNISQFGDKVGMDNDGQFKSSTQSPYFMFFEWQMCDNGTFKVFAEIVNQEELDELMSDVDDEFEESDDDMEEMNEEWKIRKTGNSHTVYKDGIPVKEFTQKDHGANRGATKKAATRFVGYMKKYMGEGKDPSEYDQEGDIEVTAEDTLYEQWKKIGKGKYSHPSQGTFEYTEHKDGWTSWQHKPTKSMTSMSGQDPHNEVKRRMKRLGIKEEVTEDNPPFDPDMKKYMGEEQLPGQILRKRADDAERQHDKLERKTVNYRYDPSKKVREVGNNIVAKSKANVDKLNRDATIAQKTDSKNIEMKRVGKVLKGVADINSQVGTPQERKNAKPEMEKLYFKAKADAYGGDYARRYPSERAPLPTNEEKDYEGDMAKSELNAIADMSKKMSSKMKDDDQLEAWVQSKITKAKDYIRAAHDNMMYDKTKDVNESELPLTGGSGPTAKEARRASEREGRESIYQKKQAAAKAAAEKRHPVGSSVSFDASHAHALGAGVDKHPGLKKYSKPGKTMTGTVVRHSTDIRNYKGNGIMNVGGADNPRYHPVVKLDKPVKVAGKTITHTTINHPYLKIKK